MVFLDHTLSHHHLHSRNGDAGQRSAKSQAVLCGTGYPLAPIERETGPTQLQDLQKRNRSMQATMMMPTFSLVDLKAQSQRFTRLVQTDPKQLCSDLTKEGLGDLTWSVSGHDRGSWECSSFLEVPNGRGDERPSSSIFVTIHGDPENRVTSFRVKLNIEDPADRLAVIDRGSVAAGVFLRQVRWATPEDITERIGRMEAFDIENFGGRLQFGREFGARRATIFWLTSLPKIGRLLRTRYFSTGPNGSRSSEIAACAE